MALGEIAKLIDSGREKGYLTYGEVNDVNSSEVLEDLLATIPREVTVVMIEHDLDVALSFAEKITVLHYGQVIVEGTRAQVVADPRVQEVYLGA